MANLNETISNVVKRTWDRAYRIMIDNVYGKPTSITFFKERATLLDEKIFSSALLPEKKVAFDPTADYPYLSPVDDSVISDEVFLTMSKHIRLQIEVYSLFRATP